MDIGGKSDPGREKNKDSKMGLCVAPLEKARPV